MEVFLDLPLAFTDLHELIDVVTLRVGGKVLDDLADVSVPQLHVEREVFLLPEPFLKLFPRLRVVGVFVAANGKVSAKGQTRERAKERGATARARPDQGAGG